MSLLAEFFEIEMSFSRGDAFAVINSMIDLASAATRTNISNESFNFNAKQDYL